MVRFITLRIAIIVVTFLLASVIIFAVTQVLPGDVPRMILGKWATDAAVENLREQLRLNRPIIVQYWDWLTSFVTGDWGTSFVSHQPVRPLIMARLRNSVMLASVAFLLYVPLGILLGMTAAINRKAADRSIVVFSMSFAGLPEFVTGPILIGLFALTLRWLPANSSIEPNASFLDALPRLILPAITISLVSLGHVSRMTRAGTIRILDKDYVSAAALRGLPRYQVYRKHVMRNALLPTVTIVAMSIGYLIGGMFVTEALYGYPGLGRYLVFSISRSDLPSIQAGCMVLVLTFAISNFIADLLYAVLNPRIRLG